MLDVAELDGYDAGVDLARRLVVSVPVKVGTPARPAHNGTGLWR